MIIQIIGGEACLLPVDAAQINCMLAVISQFEIGKVEKLIILYVPKKLKIIVAAVTKQLIFVKLVYFGFKSISDFVGKVINIKIIGIKGCSVIACNFANIGYGDLRQLSFLQKLNKGLFDAFLCGLTPFIVFGIHKNPH